MGRIALFTADDTLREELLAPFWRAGVATSTDATWEAALRALAGGRIVALLVDSALPGLDAALLGQVAASLPTPPELYTVREPRPPLAFADASRLLALTRRGGEALLDPEDRKELRLVGLGSEPLVSLQAACRAPLPVLLEGEPGTGKRQVARWLHILSGRPGPFQPLSVDRALPEGGQPGTWYLSLAGPEAPEALPGLRERALAGGHTLVVGTRARLPPEEELRWAPLRLRPLRERPAEVRELAQLYIDRYQRRLGLPRRRLDRQLWALMRAYRWPANRRELESFVVQALTSTTGAVLRAEDLPPRVRALLESGAGAALVRQTEAFEELVERRLAGMLSGVSPEAELDLHSLVVQSTERALLRLVLAHTGGNQKQAAAMLGLARNTLHTKALSLGLLVGRRRGGR